MAHSEPGPETDQCLLLFPLRQTDFPAAGVTAEEIFASAVPKFCSLGLWCRQVTGMEVAIR